MKFSGKKLCELRESAGMTQQELADRAGVIRQQITYWELNANNPQADSLGKLAGALGCKVDDFYRDNEAA